MSLKTLMTILEKLPDIWDTYEYKFYDQLSLISSCSNSCFIIKIRHKTTKIISAMKFQIHSQLTSKIIEKEIKALNEFAKKDFVIQILDTQTGTLINSTKPNCYVSFFIMPFMKYDLFEWCAKKRARTQEEQTQKFLFLKSFEILSKIHEMNYVHLDIKPENIMIKKKIIDFSKTIEVSSLSNPLILIDLLTCTSMPSSRNDDMRNTGTLLYQSVGRMTRLPITYSDDLFSLIYSLWFLFDDGELPWLEFEENGQNELVIQLKQSAILSLKNDNYASKIIKEALLHAESLKYNDKPNFNLLCQICC